MTKLFLLPLLFLMSCNFSTKDNKKSNGVTTIVRPPSNTAGISELVTESFTIQKKDQISIAALSQKAITPTHIRVVKELTKNLVLFRISKLPEQGLLFIDNIPVLLGQDVSQTDLNRGALKYVHTGLPGTDAFNFVAWNKDSMATESTFELNVRNPLDRACSENNGQGTQTWDTVDYAACELSSCDAGFYLDADICLPQICTPNTVDSCPLSNGTGTKTCNSLGNDFSSCTLATCDAGYHVSDLGCQLNVAPCLVSNGSGTQTWLGSAYSACVVSTCAPGFYSTGSSCLAQSCIPNSTASCSVTNGTGTKTCNILGSTYDACVTQSCSAGYQLNNGACEAIPVTCNYSSIPSPMYDNTGYNIPSPTTQGYNLQYRMASSLLSGISLNTSNGSISVNASAQAFNFAVEAYSSTGSAFCSLNFTVNNSLVANNDTSSTVQGSAKVIPVATLTANDISQLSRTFSITSVSNAIGGSVSLSGGNVTFTPSVLTGDAASFAYTITDSTGLTSNATVTMTISSLPQLDALIYDADEMAEMQVLLNTAPPTMQDMFDSWARFEANSYFTSKATATGDALAWEFKTNPDRVESTVNSTQYIGFISPEKLDNYIFQVDVSSTDDDDDAIALLIAFVRSGGNNYTLSAVRTQGGTSTGIGEGWALVYNYKQASQVVIGEKNVGGTYRNNTYDGWSGRSSRLKVHRNGNSIKIWASSWNSTTINDTSLIELDLNSNALYNIFKGKQSYGFAAHSQRNSTFKNITLQGGSNLDNNVIFDIANERVYRYVEGTGWVLSPEDFATAIGYPRTIYNPNTEKYYTTDRDGNVTPVP